MLRCKQNDASTPTALTGEETWKIQETTLRASTSREQYHLSASRMVSHEIQTSEGATTERPESSDRALSMGKYALSQLFGIHTNQSV